MKKIGFCLSLVWLLLMVLTPAQADPTTTAEKRMAHTISNMRFTIELK